jgi:hypothetical protein
MSRKFVFMNLLRKSTGQGRHDAEEYILPTVPVPFPEVNFGMCFEHKMILVHSTESGAEKIVRDGNLFSSHGQLWVEKQY